MKCTGLIHVKTLIPISQTPVSQPLTPAQRTRASVCRAATQRWRWPPQCSPTPTTPTVSTTGSRCSAPRAWWESVATGRWTGAAQRWTLPWLTADSAARATVMRAASAGTNTPGPSTARTTSFLSPTTASPLPSRFLALWRWGFTWTTGREHWHFIAWQIPWCFYTRCRLPSPNHFILGLECGGMAPLWNCEWPQLLCVTPQGLLIWVNGNVHFFLSNIM